MKEEKLLDAIGMVGDDLIKGAKTPKKKLKKNAIKIVAAVVAASVAVAFIWNSGATVSANYSSKYNRTFGEFAAKTTVELLKNEKENTCYSPVSLFAALALTAEATEGQTRQEILEAFGVDSIEELEEMYSQMAVDMDVDYEETPVSSNGKPTIYVEKSSKITLCNSLWISEQYLDKNSDAVIENCVKNMKADIFTEEMVEGAEVNKWVSEKTEGVIEQILDDQDLYKLLMVNTLYYKANWDFTKIDLWQRNREFELENGEKIETSFLTDMAELRYKEMSKCTVVEVPLLEGDLMLVLPNKEEKIDKIFKEKTLNEVLAMSTNSDMDTGYVDISFPEFSCESEFSDDLIKVAKKIGIKTLFGNNRWAISDKLGDEEIDVRQKAFIDVNVEGVVAGAASTIGATLGIGPQVDLEISFDRPFMYILIKNGVPMFMGTVYNPAE